MKYGIYYFSGTGNTERVVKLLAEELKKYGSAELYKINDGREIYPVCDKAIFAYPVHGFNVPANVLRFAGNFPSYAEKGFYIVKTSGEPLRLNDASSEKLVKILRKKGYVYKGEYHYVMPYNMIFRHTDEMASKMWATAKERIPACAEAIAEGKNVVKKIPFRAKLASAVCKIERKGLRFNGRFYKVDKDKCVGCLQCVRNCPVRNISYDGKDFRFGKECLGCARCAFNCPADAIKSGILNFMKVNGKYDFDRDPSEAEVGRYCRNSYIRYFGEKG